MAAHAELDRTKTTPHNALSLPRVPAPADETDIMREQLEYLIAHAADRGACGCSECERYLHVRSLLLAIFSEPERKSVHQLAAIPMAA
jgi:hypothetical protein